MDDIRTLTQFYKALGDETRLRLVALLAGQCQGRALCVGRLAEKLSVSPSAISQHLRLLKNLGLVISERQGYRIHYYLDRDALARYQRMAQECLGAALAPLEIEAPISDEEGDTMCCADQRCGCARGEERDPQECTPEQIRECHGEAGEHPCESQDCGGGCQEGAGAS